MARVQLTSEAKEDLRDLDGSERSIVVKGLRKLETEPEKRGEPLGSRNEGNLTGFRKLVVGKKQYRIIYQVEDDGTVVVIWVIAERSDDKCYQLALARLATVSNREAADQVTALLGDMFQPQAASE